MIIKKLDGCCGYNVTVDGINIDVVEPVKKAEAIENVLKKLREGLYNNSIEFYQVLELLEATDREDDDEPCDQCGHWGSDYTYEV
jgi:hypothetical protein